MTFDLPASVADSWRALGTRTGETSVVLASITAETTVYEPIEGADELAAVGASEIPARSLFAVDVTVSPSLSSLGMAPESVFEKAAPKAKSQFVDTLESEGLTVEGTRETLEFEASNGETGSWYVFDVAYPVDPEVTDGTERIDAEAHAAVWPTETTFGMAGGVLPLEDGVDTGAADSETTPEDGLDVDPERDRETIAELIRTIDFEAEDAEGEE
ncbi:hypothetical protein [Haloterrigena alkaliphila]|uniref:Uncharacterized protein n=1 Tax=Haloterrigena alkaliphila TaxID=2816475 RepID=A0A8A2VIK7_9EURY|nr:hypothetical protein [Haloterrigena alkaliphila]QSX00163.1 hypothetical protein J0X25_04130 [Haloterrigena alkaliphila]